MTGIVLLLFLLDRKMLCEQFRHILIYRDTFQHNIDVCKVMRPSYIKLYCIQSE